ncbi:hypothetical protein X942_5810 [Burkholderia pseudomallei MSHR5596]|nr:hypothetical protein X942_5810 [Burkholderia pseudomallei MSHR5596]
MSQRGGRVASRRFTKPCRSSAVSHDRIAPACMRRFPPNTGITARATSPVVRAAEASRAAKIFLS